MIVREGDGLFAGRGDSSCSSATWLRAAPAAADRTRLNRYLATCSFWFLCCRWICRFNTSARCYYLPTSTSKIEGLILLLSLKMFLFAAPELVTGSSLAPTHASGRSQCVKWADKPASSLVEKYESFHLCFASFEPQSYRTALL